MPGAPIQSAPPPNYCADSNMNEKHEYTHVAPEQAPMQTGTTHEQYPQQPQEIHQQNVHQQHTAYKQDIPTQNAASKIKYQMATPLASLQQGPSPVDCPACGVRVLTRTEFVSGGTAHLSAALCCVCLCLGCIPYIASWFKDVEHKCGHCGALLAVWHRSGRTEVMAHSTAA